jgi:GR25 family glycosyltransferase involved in LPS biosynthesis
MISSIHLIHIPDRTDRDRSIQELQKTLLSFFGPLQIQIFEAQRQKDGRKGCYESHVSVMKKAISLHDGHALIFEDDAEVGHDLNDKMVHELVQEALRFAKTETFDILFLGSFPNVLVANETIKIQGFQHMYKTSPSTTHAYIASHKFMKNMISRFAVFENVPIDDFFKSSLIQTYAIYPSIFLQSVSQSDIASPSASFVSSSKFKNVIWRLTESYATRIGHSLKHVGLVFLCFLLLLYQISTFRSR